MPAGSPPGEKMLSLGAKPILDSADHQMLRNRLRKMKARIRIVDAIKLAALWTRMRTFDRCKATIAGKQRWFATKCFNDIVEHTLGKLLDPDKRIFDSRFVEFTEDLAQLEVEGLMNNQNQNAAA